MLVVVLPATHFRWLSIAAAPFGTSSRICMLAARAAVGAQLLPALPAVRSRIAQAGAGSIVSLSLLGTLAMPSHISLPALRVDPIAAVLAASFAPESFRLSMFSLHGTPPSSQSF